MRRSRTGLAAAVLLVATISALSGCAVGRPAEPTAPSVDFTPGLAIEVNGSSLRFLPGARPDPTVDLDPPTVPNGTVVEIRNTGTVDQRLRGTVDGGTAAATFDTGVLRPGEHTVVVVTNTTDGDAVIEVTDPYDNGVHGSLTVRPTTAAG